jgi:hypothetical protein
MRLLAEFEYAVILVGAGVVAVLSLLDVISDVKPLVASALAVLSLLAFAILRQNARRRTEMQEVVGLRTSVEALSSSIAGMRRDLQATSAILEISGGSARNGQLSPCSNASKRCRI